MAEVYSVFMVYQDHDWSLSCTITLKLHNCSRMHHYYLHLTLGEESHLANKCAELGFEAMFAFRLHAFKTIPHLSKVKNIK